MTAAAPPREVRVKPNIYKTPYGWRVYVRRRNPATGRSHKKPVRFPPHVTLEELEEFRDGCKLESRRRNREARRHSQEPSAVVSGTFAEDAKTYLELKTVTAMPSYKDRARDLGLWVVVFGRRRRSTISTNDVDEQLQQWTNEGYAASTVNNRRTALMALWARLDGRAAANPVRAARVYQEPALEVRGLPHLLVLRILHAIPASRSYSHLRETKVNPVKTRVRFELMYLTGMRQSQIGRLGRQHVHFDERWYVTPRAQKGGRRSRSPRPVVRKYMTAAVEDALRRFFAFGCEGPFCASSARRLFVRAVDDVEQAMRQELADPTFMLPAGIRPYDLRHSYATEMLKQTGSLETVAELLDHSSTRMTKRYALGAVAGVLRDAAIAFEAATTEGAPVIDFTARRPAVPRRGPRQTEEIDDVRSPRAS